MKFTGKKYNFPVKYLKSEDGNVPSRFGLYVVVQRQ